ncbi:L,D-transpeptidase [Gramella jeungdoensis]|uniref:L,D-transpeptidase n=1 Tax=Gramella jeungdoensis TaxID=708091 RepID=A0ABT0YXR4_9FLAO|nr:L,D-transpeptidase [Gramella jeungdoensis]MCM8568261.1 L,D-transpeptidase [Gramella jeungdoensis]
MMKRFDRLGNIALFFIIGLTLLSCNSNTQLADSSAEESVSAMKNPIIKKEPKTFRYEVNYKLDSLNSTVAVDSLFKSYNEDQLKTILALNRMEKRRLRPEKPIVIPECASADFNTYSPFPKDLYFLKCIPKTVLISQRVQAFGLYENGELIKWGPVSTGKRSTRTPNGLNYGNYKAKRKISTVDESWILPYYFNFMNFEGIGVHQYALPGYPASHGCVRLYMDDARFIFDWADMWQVKNARITRNGTPFMVFGEYDYNAKKPWHNLTQNMEANDLTDEEIGTLKKYVEQYQTDPRNFSDTNSEIASNDLLKA